MKPIHIRAALITTCLVFAATIAAVSYATALERASVHRVDWLDLPQNITGTALQKAAFSQPDLLPIYGASEIMYEDSQFQATRFFADYPTGFAPFEVAHGGAASIIHAESIAALGADVRGKKVVISFTPSQFFTKGMDHHPYAGLFSRLHANELVFSSLLSYGTKQLAARRMLQYPETLESDPVLKFALTQLADDTLLSRILCYLSYPLGKLQTLILELQDHYAMVSFFWFRYIPKPEVPRRSATLNWNALVVMARQELMPFTYNNPFGFNYGYWNSLRPPAYRDSEIPKGGDAAFVKAIAESTEWTDFTLLLRILDELGAKPLLLGRPMNALYFHSVGISNTALDTYYTKLEALARQYGIPLVDFKNLQDDIYFSVDAPGHPSREGWVYVDRALDAFYHDVAQ